MPLLSDLVDSFDRVGVFDVFRNWLSRDLVHHFDVHLRLVADSDHENRNVAPVKLLCRFDHALKIFLVINNRPILPLDDYLVRQKSEQALLELEIARQNLKKNRLNLQSGLKEDFTFVVEMLSSEKQRLFAGHSVFLSLI
jgi:hypothetical protein